MKKYQNLVNKENRGHGDGKQYKPMIKAREFNGSGTCSNFIDWKTGRQMELLSQTELYIYMQLRWQDDVVDIKEQYPIDCVGLNRVIDIINNEFKTKGINIVKQHYSINNQLTTNLFVTKTNNTHVAIVIKQNKNNLSVQEIESLWVQKRYWNQEGCDFQILDRSDVNEVLVKNLRLVTEYYDSTRIHSEDDLIKHLIATKQICIPLDKEIIDLQTLRNLLQGDRNDKYSIQSRRLNFISKSTSNL